MSSSAKNERGECWKKEERGQSGGEVTLWVFRMQHGNLKKKIMEGGKGTELDGITAEFWKCGCQSLIE